MVIGLIIAGGVGARMHQDIPKQFLTVYEKPVIVYTMEEMQKHPQIDEIAVVCVDGWENVLQAYAKQFGITKLKHIFPGGSNGQASIRNGVWGLEKDHDADDIVLIHDAIRPMTSPDIFTECIQATIKYGCAITVIPCAEVMLTTADQKTANGVYPRDELKRTQTPHGFRLGLICDLQRRSQEIGMNEATASCSLAVDLGQEVHFCHGSERNIKLTTVEDIDIFKALLMAKRADWLKS